jgi:hypothetical protein
MSIEREVIQRISFKIRVASKDDLLSMRADAERIINSPPGTWSNKFTGLAKAMIEDIKKIEGEVK